MTSKLIFRFSVDMVLVYSMMSWYCVIHCINAGSH